MSRTIAKIIFSFVSILLISNSSFSDTPKVSIRVLDEYEAGSRAANRGNHKFALIFFKQCAKKGNPRCYFGLGSYHYFGDGGVKKNYPIAFKLMQKGAKGHYGPAEFLLGIMYRRGHGIRKDTHKSMEWVERAAYKCIPQAQADMGRFFMSVKKPGVNELMNSIAWLKLASSNGHKTAAKQASDMMREMPPQGVKETNRIYTLLAKRQKCQNF